MPLPEVVVGAGVVVVVMVLVGAEDGCEAGREGEVHKGNQTQTQNHHLDWRRGRRKRGEKWTLHHHPGPDPDHQPDHQCRAVEGVAAVVVGAEVVAIQGDIRPPDRLCCCDYY